MRGLRFQIRHPHGQVDALDVEAERATIGSGAHCEIRLPVDQARTEHVRIDLAPAGVYATAISFEPSPTLNGVSFTQGVVPPESVLGVGQTQILVQPLELGGAVQSAKSQGVSPMMIFSVLMMMVGGWLFFFNKPEDGEETFLTKSDAPALWKTEVATCPQAGPAALVFAREQFAQATTKRERRPFYVQDGVAAVPIFERAAACFKVGGDPSMGQYSDGVATYLRADLNQDYKKQRVKLEYHVRTADWTSARRDVRSLLAFTEGQPSDYRSWLQETERKLQLKASRDNVRK